MCIILLNHVENGLPFFSLCLDEEKKKVCLCVQNICMLLPFVDHEIQSREGEKDQVPH